MMLYGSQNCLEHSMVNIFHFYIFTAFWKMDFLISLASMWSAIMISKISDIILWDKSCMLCTIFPIMDVHCVLWDRLVFFFFFVCFDSMDNQSQYQYTITKKACQKNSSCFWLVERETVFSAEPSLMQTATYTCARVFF